MTAESFHEVTKSTKDTKITNGFVTLRDLRVFVMKPWR